MPKRTTNTCTLQSLATACAALPCPVPQSAVPALHEYLTLLMRYNAVMNLVGTRTWRDTLEVLLSDSFYLAEFLRNLPLPEAPLCVEPGAGAGLPGIPLRMAWQQGDYTLIEVRQKRALFMNTVLARVSLPCTRVYQGRIEDFCAAMPAPADMWVSRAFMPWRDVLALAAPYTRVGGVVVFLLLEPAPQTLPQGWTLLRTQRYTVRDATRWFWALARTPDN